MEEDTNTVDFSGFITALTGSITTAEVLTVLASVFVHLLVLWLLDVLDYNFYNLA